MTIKVGIEAVVQMCFITSLRWNIPGILFSLNDCTIFVSCIVFIISNCCHLLISIFKTVLEKITTIVSNNFHTFVPWRQILLFSRCTICIVHCFHNIKLSLVADHRSGLMWMHCINWSGLIWVEGRVFWHRKETFSSISCFQKAFLDDMLFSPFLANILGKLYFEQTLLTKLCTSVYFTCLTTFASFSSTA